MVKPRFYFDCIFVVKNWEDTEFGGEVKYLCRRMKNQPCDESICMRNKTRIVEKVEEKAGIVERDQTTLGDGKRRSYV